MTIAPASADTGVYCKARKRLPRTLLSRLAKRVGWTLSNKADGSLIFLLVSHFYPQELSLGFVE